MSAQKNEMTFGSKAWNEYYHGRNKGARAKGDRANRAKDCLKKSLTKKGEREELERRRSEFESEGGKLAKAQQAEDMAVSRILADGAHALKISKPSGNFTPEDVSEFQRQGWGVASAGTAPAKVGASLPAKTRVELNPKDEMARILGPELLARAVVITSPEPMSEDLIDAWRRAGYDVSAAPKRLRQRASAKVNPTGAEQKKLYEALKKTHGAPRSVEELAEAAKIPPAEALASLTRLESLGLAYPAGQSLFGPLWAPGAPSRGLFAEASQPEPRGLFAEVNPAPTGRKLAILKCRIAGYHGDAKAWTEAYTEGKISRTTADTAWSVGQQDHEDGRICDCYACKKAKVNPTPQTPGAKPRQTAPKRGTAKKPTRQAGFMTVSKPTPRATKANPTNASETAREALEQSWERWTGAKAGASLTLSVKDRGDCPKAVVMLGRVSELISPTGALKSFGESGPFLVTNAAMKRVWLIDVKARRFDMDLSLIAYLAKKPKFGDREPVKYIHNFTGKARAAMNGNAGELTGSFRLTPRGIEG